MKVPIPFVLQVDNAACLAFSKDQVQRSKLRHIDCRQEWVQALRDANVVSLEHVDSKDNFADLFTKILDAETPHPLRRSYVMFTSLAYWPGDVGGCESRFDRFAASQAPRCRSWWPDAIMAASTLLGLSRYTSAAWSRASVSVARPVPPCRLQISTWAIQRWHTRTCVPA